MVKTPGQITKEYAEKPFDLYSLRGEQFTIVEDLPYNKPIREGHFKTKDGRDYSAYLIKVSSGIFQKDLKLFETELTKLFILAPTSVKNFKGATFAVGREDKRDITFVAIVTDDMNEGFNSKPDVATPITAENTQKIEKKDIEAKQLYDAIQVSAMMGTQVTAKLAMQIGDKIAPGRALELITYAKETGMIVQNGDNFTAV